jgi:transporter family protein
MEDSAMNEMVLAIAAILCWGIAPLFAKLGLQQADPLVGLTVRSALVTTGIILVSLFTGRLALVRQLPVRSVVLLGADGLLAGFAAQLAFYWALKMGEASTITPLVAAYPLVTVALAALLLGEKLTVAKSIGAVLIAAGVFLIKR